MSGLYIYQKTLFIARGFLLFFFQELIKSKRKFTAAEKKQTAGA